MLPPSTGIAFILIQHLDPTHASMMAELLAGHTPLKVQQAADGMPLEREHIYLIPPGAYLSIRGGTLRLLEPSERHGARLPFDFFLRSLAEELGDRAICVILSGTGGDGSLGLEAVNEKGGLVIAQDPDEAEYDGMPRSAIMTGAVDLVLPVAKIPETLAKYGRQLVLNGERRKGLAPDDHHPDRLAEIINLLRAKTAHDFALYKPGTLLRRIADHEISPSVPVGPPDPTIPSLTDAAFEADGEELLRLDRWRTSWFTGTVACSGLDNQESDPASPFRSQDSSHKPC
jgi:two-component system, chemotaxis family, CheB/CheR fusion protein